MSSSTIGTERAVYSPAPKLARIGGTFILLLGALTAVGPFSIDMYLAAFPQIQRRHPRRDLVELGHHGV